ncbi:uncharacterized protein LOC127758077 [Oryza glaberrima]|nr:uncharacterized protein LOC127758077 [Oryza glaberrima]
MHIHRLLSSPHSQWHLSQRRALFDLFFFFFSLHSVCLPSQAAATKMDTARRRPRRVPAFGEWNYYHGGDELPSAAAAGGAPDDQEASSDVWFRYSPAPRKPAPKKARRRAADNRQKPVGGGNKRRPARTSSSDSGAATAASNTPAKLQQAAATAKVAVVRRPPAVDADLYQVPPPDFLPGEPIRRKKAGRSMWMGCLGLSC